jgi:phage I-like protein
MVTENIQPTEDQAQPAPAEVEPTTAEPTTAPERTFTQEEVNRMQAQTRRDERNKYGDYNDLKARAAKADELEQAQLSDAQKLEARAIEAERKASEAQEQIASAMIASEVKVRASALGVIDPDAAYLLLDRSNVRYDATEGVTGVDDALASLLEAKPYLKSSNRTPNLNPESGQPVATQRLTAEQREAAQYLGMTDEQYAKGL